MNENNFDITSWLKVFQERLISLFGNRIKFFGLQGSYGRGEQTALRTYRIISQCLTLSMNMT